MCSNGRISGLYGRKRGLNGPKKGSKCLKGYTLIFFNTPPVKKMIVNDTTLKKSLYLCIKFLEKLNDRLIVTSLPSFFLEGSGRSPGIVKLPETFFYARKSSQVYAGKSSNCRVENLYWFACECYQIEKKERFLEILYQSMMISEIKIVPLHYVSETPPRRGLKK